MPTGSQNPIGRRIDLHRVTGVTLAKISGIWRLGDMGFAMQEARQRHIAVACVMLFCS